MSLQRPVRLLVRARHDKPDRRRSSSTSRCSTGTCSTARGPGLTILDVQSSAGDDVAAHLHAATRATVNGVFPSIGCSTSRWTMRCDRGTRGGACGTVLAPPFEVEKHGRMAVLRVRMARRSRSGSRARTGRGREQGTGRWLGGSEVPNQKRPRIYSTLFGGHGRRQGAERGRRPARTSNRERRRAHRRRDVAARQLEPHAPPHWMIYFTVATARPPRRRPPRWARRCTWTRFVGENGHHSVIADPQGAVFALHQAP